MEECPETEMNRNTERKVKGRQDRRVYFVRGFSCFCSVKKEIQPWIFVSFGPIQKKGGEKEK
jgi:hypothetical protein